MDCPVRNPTAEKFEPNFVTSFLMVQFCQNSSLGDSWEFGSTACEGQNWEGMELKRAGGANRVGARGGASVV